jgi:hypothetical protein
VAANHTYVFTEGVTATRRAPDEAVPSIRLAQNYPNPFSTATSIRFTVAETGPVRLDVFDALGRRVAVLADGIHPAGTHSVIFEAGHLSGGVYLYRLQAGWTSATKAMLLAK